MMVDEYEVMNAHYFRKCHSETCGCDSDFLVINKEKNSIAGKVNSREEGRKLIKIMGLSKTAASIHIVDGPHITISE